MGRADELSGVPLAHFGPKPLRNDQRQQVKVQDALRNRPEQAIVRVGDKDRASARIAREGSHDRFEGIIRMSRGWRQMNQAWKLTNRRLQCAGAGRALTPARRHGVRPRFSWASTRASSSVGTNGLATKSSAPAAKLAALVFASVWPLRMRTG